MTTLSADLEHRLLYILHYGMNQARNLALGGQHQQVFALLDALEIVPSLMARWEDQHFEFIRSILEDYQRHYPGSAFNYVGHLEEYNVPDRF